MGTKGRIMGNDMSKGKGYKNDIEWNGGLNYGQGPKMAKI